MRESEKSRVVRSGDFFEKYLTGRIIDIGSGNDPVVAHAEEFDQEHGDANEILRHRSPASYDTVYSSHCLEHMRSPPDALRQWWELVRPGGHLILVVPEENLYEQGYWPSPFNPDHKATFRLNGPGGSQVSYDIQDLVLDLPRAELISAEVQDHGYDYALRSSGEPFSRIVWRPLRYLTRACGRVGIDMSSGIGGLLVRGVRRMGFPVDQTLGGALAQIEVVVRKSDE